MMMAELKRWAVRPLKIVHEPGALVWASGFPDRSKARPIMQGSMSKRFGELCFAPG
jgi:hypothetical protein